VFSARTSSAGNRAVLSLCILKAGIVLSATLAHAPANKWGGEIANREDA
jgi:hypothetical protein